MIDNKKLKEFILNFLNEKKAEKINIIELKDSDFLAKYIILANARSTKNNRAIAENLALELKNLYKFSINIEGIENSQWILVDAHSILVNIFSPETREYFNLDEMWQKRN